MPVLPDYFRRRNRKPKYPGLWRGLGFLASPELGATGGVLYGRNGMGFTGTLTNYTLADAWDYGGAGMSLKGNGSNSYVDFGDICKVTTNDFSIGVWFRRTTAANGGLIVKTKAGPTNGRYGFYLDSTGTVLTLLAEAGPGTTFQTATLGVAADSQWHLAVGTYDRDGLMRLYYDGRERATADISAGNGNDWTTTFSFFLSAYADSTGAAPLSGYSFNGNIGTAFFYDRLLTHAEVFCLSRSSLTHYASAPRKTYGVSTANRRRRLLLAGKI